jgi:hypothetical protein
MGMKKMTLSQRAWEWIRQQPDFTSGDLAQNMDVSLYSAQMIISHLQDKAALKRTNTGVNPAVYQAVKDFEPHLPGKNTTAPRPSCMRQKVWQAMRFLNDFTVGDLMATAECTRSTAERFICDLVRFEYVFISKPQQKKARMSERKGSEVRYRMLKNTGRLYPIIRPDGLYDQNTKKLIVRPVRQQKRSQKNELA